MNWKIPASIPLLHTHAKMIALTPWQLCAYNRKERMVTTGKERDKTVIQG
jgi:hypothetical protein